MHKNNEFEMSAWDAIQRLGLVIYSKGFRA